MLVRYRRLQRREQNISCGNGVVDAEHLEDLDVGRVVDPSDRLLDIEMFLCHCRAMRLSSSSAVTARIASARSIPVCDRNFTSHPSPRMTMLPSCVSSQSARAEFFSMSVTSWPRSSRSRDM